MEIDNLITFFEQKLMIQRYSTSSIKNYSSSVNSFLQVAAKKFEHPNQLSEQEIEKYILWKIEKHKISSSYQRMIVASIDKFYNLVMNQNLQINHLYPSRKKDSLPKYITKAEVKRMLASITNIKHKCIIKLLYGCGLRLSELLNLKLSDIDSELMLVHVKDTKGNKDRVVMLSTTLLDDLRKYYKDYYPKYYLFEGQSGGKYSSKGVQNIVKIAATKGGISKPVTPHI